MFFVSKSYVVKICFWGGERGDQVFYKNGRVHRDGDLPALIDADGAMNWYNKGDSYKRIYPEEDEMDYTLYPFACNTLSTSV